MSISIELYGGPLDGTIFTVHSGTRQLKFPHGFSSLTKTHLKVSVYDRDGHRKFIFARTELHEIKTRQEDV